MFPPTSSPTPRRARRRMALLGAVLALLLLGGCTGRKPTPTDYGETTRTNFLLGCNEEADAAGVSKPDAYCKCSYSEIVKTIPYDEFKKINSDLSDDPGPLPPKMLKIRDELHRRDLGLRLRSAPPPAAHRPAASWAGAGAPVPGTRWPSRASACGSCATACA